MIFFWNFNDFSLFSHKNSIMNKWTAELMKQRDRTETDATDAEARSRIGEETVGAGSSPCFWGRCQVVLLPFQVVAGRFLAGTTDLHQ